MVESMVMGYVEMGNGRGSRLWHCDAFVAFVCICTACMTLEHTHRSHERGEEHEEYYYSPYQILISGM